MGVREVNVGGKGVGTVMGVREVSTGPNTHNSSHHPLSYISMGRRSGRV